MDNIVADFFDRTTLTCGTHAKQSTSVGFSLLELMITLVIIGILVTVAVPSYLGYTKKAHYVEIVNAAAPYKVGVVECYSTTEDLSRCDGGTNGIPTNRVIAVGGVKSVTVSQGVITVIPVTQNGLLEADTYVLTPSVTDGVVMWSASGGGISKGYS